MHSPLKSIRFLSLVNQRIKLFLTGNKYRLSINICSGISPVLQTHQQTLNPHNLNPSFAKIVNFITKYSYQMPTVIGTRLKVEKIIKIISSSKIKWKITCKIIIDSKDNLNSSARVSEVMNTNLLVRRSTSSISLAGKTNLLQHIPYT